MKKPTIAVLTTGGTIVSAGKSSRQMTGYSIDETVSQSLLASVPEVAEIANIVELSVCNIGSSAMTSEIWCELARLINGLATQDDMAGFVVTHGTDTLEETAFFLNLVVKTHKPVVLTGAMRPATALSADGPINLLNAVTVAGNDKAVGKGVLIVLNGIINGARDTQKTNTLSVETFKSLDFGAMGYVVGSTVEFLSQSLKPHTLASEFSVEQNAGLLPYVEIIFSHADDSGRMIEAAVEAGAKGLVLATCGHGSIAKTVEPTVRQAIQKSCVVVRATRVSSGPVLEGQQRWQQMGVIAAGSLSAPKARILLQLALAKYGANQAQVTRCFATY